MAYIGQEPLVEFSSIPTKDSFTGDGSTVAFDMSAAVVSAADNALEVFVDNVRQEPGSGKAYTVGLDGSNENKRITFSAAPASGAAIYVINDKSNTTTLVTPTNLGGVELILDADSDTSITADTDDQIDFKIGSADHLKILSSSGDTVFKPMVDAKDIVFQQFDGNKIFCIDDGNFVSVGGNSAAPGEIRIYEDTDLGANYTGFKAGNLTASVAYQLPLADGSSGQALATDGSGVLSWTTIATNTPTSANGQALGSASLEWSDLFLADGAVINFGDDQDITLTHVADTGLLLNGASVIQFRDSGLTIGSNADGDLDIVSDGTAVDSINIESAGGITLDAGTAGSGVIYEDDGTEMMRIHNSSSDVILETKVSDKDFIIKGNDGGSVITPLTLDMSAGGDLFLTGGLIDLKNDGTAVSQIKFYCESSNAHAQTLIGAPHAQSATNTLTLPDGSDGVLVSTVSTATLTNKTLTSPVINTGTFGTSILPTSADGTTLGSASKEFSDLFLADSSTIQFGNDQDTTLTHTDGAGLTLNSTNKLMFNDASQFIQGASATVLDIAATDEIELTATLIDVVGNATVSGTLGVTGVVSGAGFTAGSAVLAEAELELLDGLTAGTAIASKVVTTDANIDTTGQRNLTISGELDAATLDISGNADIDGITNLDVVDIDGAVDMASTLQVDGAITSSAGATITTADNTDTLSLISTDADATSGPHLRLFRNSSSPADSDDIGKIIFSAENSASEEIDYGIIRGDLTDVTDGTEDGVLKIETMSAGSSVEMARFGDGVGVSINETGNADVDFRVESDSNAHMFIVNAGNNLVGIGADPDLGAGLHIKTADSGATATAHGDELVIEDGTSGANVGMSILSNTNGEARINFGDSDDNDIGMIRYDHADNKLHLVANNTSVITLTSGEIVMNDGSNDQDFRVESNGNANMLFVDGGNDRIGVGTASPSRFIDAVTSANSPTMEIRSSVTPNGSKIGGGLLLSLNQANDSGSGANDTQAGDVLGRVVFQGQGTDYTYNGAEISTIVTVGDGNDGRVNQATALVFKTIAVGGDSSAERFRVSEAGIHIGGTGAANALDDYEEGTYDVTMTVASGSLTPSGSSNALAYTKIGRVVHVQGEIRFSAISSPSGNMSISLPFAVADLVDGAARFTSAPIGQASFNGTPNQTYYLRTTSEGSTTAFIATHNSGSDTGVNANQVTTNTEMIISFSFIAA